MKPAPFNYHRPRTLLEAVEMVTVLPDAKLLAGGQSLGPMLNFRYLMPENIIDLNHVEELSGIWPDRDDVIHIGSMTRQYQLQKDPLLAKKLPILADALQWVGHYATRNRGTFGGSLAHLDPSAELPGICTLLDAELSVQGRSGIRRVSMHDWSKGFMQPDLNENEILTSISLRPWPEPHGACFLELSRRHGDFAIAGVACLVSLDDNEKIRRFATSVIGVANGPVRLRQAEKSLPGERYSESLAIALSQEIGLLEAPGDAHHSGDFRKRTAKTLFQRAVQHA
ncbi:MAG: FAD binding domain-containing protein [Burkholderiaceae bacterium]